MLNIKKIILTKCEVSNENRSLLVAARVLALVGVHSQHISIVNRLMKGAASNVGLLQSGNVDESN